MIPSSPVILAIITAELVPNQRMKVSRKCLSHSDGQEGANPNDPNTGHGIPESPGLFVVVDCLSLSLSLLSSQECVCIDYESSLDGGDKYSI